MPKKDYSVFPEIISSDGEIIDAEFVAFALSREGRRAHGKEYPNPIPMEPPLGYVDHVPLHEQIAMMIRQQLSTDGDEPETEEDANDFDVGDDFDPSSPWEVGFEPTMPWADAVKQIMSEAAKIGEAPPAPAASAGAAAPGGEPAGGQGSAAPRVEPTNSQASQ